VSAEAAYLRPRFFRGEGIFLKPGRSRRVWGCVYEAWTLRELDFPLYLAGIFRSRKLAASSASRRPAARVTQKSGGRTGSPPLTEAERELLMRHRRGEPGAFAELLARYRAPVFAYLFRSGVPERAREDLFQEIFLKVHRSADQYAPERPLHPWLFTIVANTVRNFFRSDSRQSEMRRELAERDGAQADAPVPHPSAPQLLEAEETVARIEAKIAQLPEPQREVILLCCVEGLSQQQVAELLGCPVNTVKTHLRQARLALAKSLLHGNRELHGEESS
jgi:RNA polymerase sigma-70 factor (ECF subfamily)